MSEQHQRPAPRERTFAEVFPWRNIRRAAMLLMLIVAIVVIKRSTGPLLSRVGEMWGAPAAAPPPVRDGFRVRLGSGLAPPQPPADKSSQ